MVVAACPRPPVEDVTKGMKYGSENVQFLVFFVHGSFSWLFQACGNMRQGWYVDLMEHIG